LSAPLRIPLPGSPSVADRASFFEFTKLWFVLRKYWPVALATMILVALGTTFYTLGQTKIYQVSATIELDPNPPRPLGKSVETVVDMGSGSYWNNREYYETQYKVLQSMRVALAVVKDLELNRDGEFIKNTRAATRSAPTKPVSVEEAAEILLLRLRVDPVKDSRLFTTTLEDADPARAQRILSSIIDTFVAQNLDDALSSTSSAADWLHGQLDKLKVDLEDNEMALHDYKANKNLLSVAFDDQSNMLRGEMKQINEALTSVQTKREELAARVAEFQKLSADDPTNLPASELLSSPLLTQVRERYNEAIRDREALLGAGKGENHPEVMAATNRIAAARASLLAEVKNVQGALSRDLAVLNREDSGLNSMFERAKRQAMGLNLLEIEYNRLQRSKDNTEKLYSLVLEKSKESDLTRMLRVNNIRVLDRPLMPMKPLRPRVPLNIAVGIAFGALLGVLAALARAALDTTLKVPADLETDLGVTPLGLIPVATHENASPYGRRRRRPSDLALGTAELVVHEQPMSGVAEAARAIRTNLLFMAPDVPFRTLLVTSANPSEGKTTVACSIAIAMAQADQRVLIIDCDLRRPRIHRIFKKASDRGVTTAILDETGDSDEVMDTGIPNLCVMPSGPIPPNPAELFHSDRFRQLLQRMAKRFDRIVIDSPPAIVVTDAVVLSTMVDATVFVGRASSTRKDAARHALRSLQDVGARIAGAVLNAVDLSRHEYQSANYYYYRKGYYNESGEDPSASSRGTSGPSAPAPH
jgi:polysaccharide biosynthesis transport protein